MNLVEVSAEGRQKRRGVWVDVGVWGSDFGESRVLSKKLLKMRRRILLVAWTFEHTQRFEGRHIGASFSVHSLMCGVEVAL